ncbi:hypothetical protein EDC04DRAFT_1881359 [Pisolithus marmoratus]|nr:hypothetical protein EDC04DRAFT_1881359 [Pisolithus marmoratus]
MAPARSNRRTTHQEQPGIQLRNTPSDTNATNKTDLFLEPMMGTPLTVYIEKDVDEKESLVELITKHGGAVSPGYSGTPYILGMFPWSPLTAWLIPPTTPQSTPTRNPARTFIASMQERKVKSSFTTGGSTSASAWEHSRHFKTTGRVANLQAPRNSPFQPHPLPRMILPARPSPPKYHPCSRLLLILKQSLP